MSDVPQIAIDRLPQVNFLKFDKWQEVKQTALRHLENEIPEPTRQDFAQATISRYPKEMVWMAAVSMALLAGFAFIVSAGKELVVADRVLSSLSRDFGVVLWWQHLAMVALLLVGEIGALCFALASSMFSRKRFIQVIFRVASICCASVALIGNATLAGLDPHPMEGVFEFAVTFLPPLIVLVVGLVGEQMLLEYLEDRLSIDEAYQAARYERIVRLKSPLKEPTYRNALVAIWAVEMVGIQPTAERHGFRMSIDSNLDLRRLLFEQQYRTVEQANFSDYAPTNPSMPQRQ